MRMDESGTAVAEWRARVLALSQGSMARAAESLSGLLGHPVHLTLQDLLPLAVSALPLLAERVDQERLAGLSVEITGEGAGRMLVLLPMATVSRILQVLLEAPMEEPMTELERSAIREVGNILASAFLSELGRQLGRRFMHSPPELVLTSIPQLVQEFLGRLRGLEAEVLVAEALLQVPERDIQGRLFVVPAIRSLEPIAPGTGKEERA
jgi:chemotaxis protein CheC